MREPSFTHRFREFRSLLLLNLKVKLGASGEFLKVLLRYYRSLSFAKVDLVFLAHYLFKSPFRINKEYLLAKGEEDPYTYGETPLTTLDQISREAKIAPSDTVYELGCGRGRTCFWLAKQIGCKVVGVDQVPTFIQKADSVRRICEVDGLQFRCENFLKMDLSKATVVYLYGTCYGDEFLHDLIERMRELPSGTKVISVSYPLTDYTEEPLFEVMKVFPAKFTWGTAHVYLQYRT